MNELGFHSKGFDGSFGEKDFNSSISFLERVERRWEDANQGKLRGDVEYYFRSLEIISRSTFPFFTEDEKITCKQLILSIESFLKNQNQKSSGQTFVWAGENKCDILYEFLASLLFKYKITYYKKEKEDIKDELNGDFAGTSPPDEVYED